MSTSSQSKVPALSATTHFEFASVDRTKANENHLLVRLHGHKATKTERKSLRLIACIDLSGSMEGKKVEQLRSSLQALVRNLTPQDTLGIVAFSTTAWDICKPMKCDAAGKKKLDDAIVGIRTHSSTNLSGGVADAVVMLQGMDTNNEDAIQRILLMTDGMPTAGVTEKDGLLGFIGKCCPSNISISTFGYGSGDGVQDQYGGFDPVLLDEIAKLCRGNFYHISGPEKVAEILGAELGGLVSVAAQTIRITLELNDNVAVKEVLNDFDVDSDDKSTTIRVNDIYDDERKSVVVQLTLPEMSKAVSGPRPKKTIGTMRITWINTETGETETYEEKLSVEFVKPEDAQQTPDPQVQKEVALLKAAKAQIEANEAAQAGNFAQARHLVQVANVGLRNCQLFETDQELQELNELTADDGKLGASMYFSHSYGDNVSQEARGVTKGLMSKRDAGGSLGKLYRTSVVSQTSSLLKADAEAHSIPDEPQVDPLPVHTSGFVAVQHAAPAAPPANEPYRKTASRR